MNARAWSALVLALAVLGLAPWLPAGGWDEFVFWQLRVPRTLMAFLVGATMGLAGAVYQSLFANPLATPDTLGTTAGAALGALAALVLFGQQQWVGLPLAVAFAFAGALLVTAIVVTIALHGRARINDVLLAGIAISLAAGALASGLQFTADLMSTFQAVRWSLGNLAQVGYQKVLLMAPVAAAAAALMLHNLRALAALAAGEEQAHAQGVDVRRVRGLTLGAGALGVGACVALCGPIAFVGLIVPHLVRLALGASRRVLLPLAWLWGGAFLVVCDVVSRVVLPQRELPVGVITAALGAPLLVWLIAHQGRRRQR